MRPQSCNYQQMYDMPCRMACDRYTSPGDQFEGALPKEAYEFEPEIRRELYTPLPLHTVPRPHKKQMVQNQLEHETETKNQNKNKNKNKFQSQQNQACNCSPKIYIKESYDYDPRLFQSGNTESYTNPSNPSAKSGCACAVNNPPYRIHECNYNQSPSWITQKSGVPMTEGFELAPNTESSCKCTVNNPPYRIHECNYNQSPSWITQKSGVPMTEGFTQMNKNSDVQIYNPIIHIQNPQNAQNVQNIQKDLTNPLNPLTPPSVSNASTQGDCGCGNKPSNYRMESTCVYNQSPTWEDQASFRENVLNKY